MSNEVKEYFEKFQKSAEKMKELTPDAVAAFSGLFAKTIKDGALSVKEKELIALGMGLVLRCEPCIRMHTKKCLDAGATKEQVLDVASVALMMGGGPVYTHIPLLIETVEALTA